MVVRLQSLAITACVLWTASPARAQLNVGGLPPSWEDPTLSKRSIPKVTLAPVDVAKHLIEDAKLGSKPRPWRFGAKLPVSIDPTQSGLWDQLPAGDRMWRVGIRSPGALTLNFIFDRYELPPGARLYIYSVDRSSLLGGFTELNNQPAGKFATTLMPTDEVVLEYVEPLQAQFPGKLGLGTVIHGYRDIFSFTKAFGESGSCNNNVACPEAVGWEDQIRSVVMLVVGGEGFCSGALVNNTVEDGTPYVLTADHCSGPPTDDPSTWVFWFNWQSPTCTNPPTSPAYDSLSGALLRARRSDSDFYLLELNDTPPAGFNAYYSGWDNSGSVPASTVGIHHPSGDIKKISFDYDPAVLSSYSGDPGDDHWQVTGWDDGTTEGGSSGSPLYDPAHRIIGQLHGGAAACGNNEPDWYGRVATSWDGASADQRLRDWLDPSGTGATVLDGWDPNTVPVPLDAAVQRITIPASGSTLCGGTFTPVAWLRNRGTDTLTSVTLTLTLDSVVVETYNWTGSLASGATEEVTFAPQTAAPGLHTLTVTSSGPNGGTDQNLANDRASSSFAVADGIPVPLTEGFEDPNFPPPGWTLLNPDVRITWVRGPPGGFDASANSMNIDNFNYNSSGRSDTLFTPYLDLSSAGPAAALDFSVAHARYSASNSDRMRVLVSTDCGNNWTVEYDKSGTVLATASDTTSPFVPTSTQWRAETVSLAGYDGEPLVLIAFQSITGYGNNLFVDDIAITGDVDADGDGYTAAEGDCNDNDATIHPAATEVCDGVDNDCAGGVDDGLTFVDYWPDTDSDGYGDAAATPTSACDGAPTGMVDNNADCDDSNASVNPGRDEKTCNRLDDDCDAATVDNPGDGTCDPPVPRPPSQPDEEGCGCRGSQQPSLTWLMAALAGVWLGLLRRCRAR